MDHSDKSIRLRPVRTWRKEKEWKDNKRTSKIWI